MIVEGIVLGGSLFPGGDGWRNSMKLPVEKRERGENTKGIWPLFEYLKLILKTTPIFL